MRKRQARIEAEALWGKDFHLANYRCRKKGCKHEGCAGLGEDARRLHYLVGVNQKASGVLPTSFVVKGVGFSWDEALDNAKKA